jgi:hopene-associated glycosyltransferase HpnB
MLGDIIATLSIVAWVYLLFGRGSFWLTTGQEAAETVPVSWPHVTAIVPARDEAACIGRNIASLLAQDYPGALDIIVVDDASRDATAQAAGEAAKERPDEFRLIQAPSLPAGWSGKLWAIQQGVLAAGDAGYLLLCDADIVFGTEVVKRLVARSESGGLVLNSIMATLRCLTFWERAFVPAFVFFFRMLYPFARVNKPGDATAAAAGGCMLVKANALREAGGISAIRGELIDDCALARNMKQAGPIRLALSRNVKSVRPYPRIADFRQMVVRSAYTQLNCSVWMLAATTIAMLVAFVAAPALVLFANGFAQLAGLAAWLVMALAYQPILRFYRQSPFWGFLLPAIASAYLVWTFDSALQHVRGRGGVWKGRVQAQSGAQ